MAHIHFTPNLQRHIETPQAQADGETVREVLRNYFNANPLVSGYILDDQGIIRKHIAIFINGELIVDRVTQSDAVNDTDEIYVVQALSGGCHE